MRGRREGRGPGLGRGLGGSHHPPTHPHILAPTQHAHTPPSPATHTRSYTHTPSHPHSNTHAHPPTCRRAAETNNVGQKLRDGANINRSLLALANCINALGKGARTGAAYVPYRNSKLTR